MWSRGRRDWGLIEQTNARSSRQQANAQALQSFARAGYRLYALNLASNEEIYLGFVSESEALTFIGAALSDVDYDIRVRADGHFWHDCRNTAGFSLSIKGGEISAPLPMIKNLSYSLVSDAMYLCWTWELNDGLRTPDDFAIWVGLSEPVNTSVTPNDVVPASAPGAVTITIERGSDALFLAICARRGGLKGPASVLTIPATEQLIGSPENQNVAFN